MRKSNFIVFEGISACGKSEYIKRVIEILKTNNCSYYLYEWNSNHFFRVIIELLEKLGLLSADIFAAIQYISFLYDVKFKLATPSKKVDYILCDRYIYTGMVRDKCNGSKHLPFLSKKICFSVPDYIFYIKTPPTVCYERIIMRKKKIRYFADKSNINSTLSYLKNCEQEYDRILITMNTSVVKIIDSLSSENLDELETILL